jgi:hypothetical protein
MISPSPSLSRRTFLRGAGATLALPWLESVLFAETKKTAAPPKRWVLMTFGNGVADKHWWAKGEGEAMQLGDTLRPLAPFKRDILPIEGMRLFDEKPGGGVHWPWFTNFLSGKEISPTPLPDVAESLDHYMARKIGSSTAVPMLNLGCEKVFSGVRNGWPSIYSATMSWSSRKAPIPAEIYPRQAFDRLFDTTALLQNRSVVDAVLDEAKTFATRLSTDDRARLDEYLHDVREVERRMDTAASEGRLEGWRPSLTKPDMRRPPADLPRDLPEHMRLMADILVLALRMDKTRIATLMLNNDLSEQRFTFLDGVKNNDIMHNISHHQGKAQTLAEYQRINEYHVRQLAYVLGKMKAVTEAEGVTLLDQSMLLFGSSMMDGMTHDATKLPLILCGTGGGTVKPGRVLTVEKPEQKRLCNLHLALLNRMGVPDKQFGNSQAPLAGLS